MEKYKAKGIINFAFDNSDVVIEEREFNLYEKDLGWDEFSIYDLMSGKRFLYDVDNGFLIDYDGSLAFMLLIYDVLLIIRKWGRDVLFRLC